MRSPRGDVTTSPAIVAAITVALCILDTDADAQPADAPQIISSWRAAGRIYDTYDSRNSPERRP